jgi:hypothetical protein
MLNFVGDGGKNVEARSATAIKFFFTEQKPLLKFKIQKKIPGLLRCILKQSKTILFSM